MTQREGPGQSSGAAGDAGGSGLAPLLLEILRATDVVHHLHRYFAESSGDDDLSGYTGRHFERLGGGGDRQDVADGITAADLLAVQTLSVSVPPGVAVHLLEGHLGVEVNRLLRQVPTDVTLGSPAAERHLAPDAAASRCWQLLVDQDGVGWVTAGKLLARKRPRLVPVFDEVVRCALGKPRSFWLALNRTVLEPRTGVATTLAELQSHVPIHVSPLRILDVAVWMLHAEHHRLRC